MNDLELQVNGTLIWYYYICKRQVWLMAHSLAPDQDDERLSQGRDIHEFSYPRDRKEIDLGNIKVDLVRTEKGKLIIGEIKKSSKFLTSATRQLQFYLWQFEQMGIEAWGELLIPEERKRIKVLLDDAVRLELDLSSKDILEIAGKTMPPPAQKTNWCKTCAYAEFCWA